MPTTASLRYWYTRLFVFGLLCSFMYVMVKSMDLGTAKFQDSFYQKAYLIEKANLLRLKIRNRVFPTVLLGEHGWMHYTGDGELNYFQHLQKMENENDLVAKLKTLNQYAKSQGITLLIVVAPNKSTIYADTVPGQIKPLSPQSWLDSLLSYSGDPNMPVVVDLRPALMAERQERDVFYKTDTHWNGYGAFAAYKTIISTLQRSHPELEPYEIADLNLKLVITDPEIQDTVRMMGVNTIKEPSLFIAPKKPFVQTLHPFQDFGYNQFSVIPDSKLPKLLAFHDSQGAHYLNDYLSMNFSESHFIHYLSIPEYLTKTSIQHFQPNIIIIEIVERALNQLNGLLVDWESA
jgi:alginate O-acetyltransferase complex protein AlgJ